MHIFCDWRVVGSGTANLASDTSWGRKVSGDYAIRVYECTKCSREKADIDPGKYGYPEGVDPASRPKVD